MDKTVSEPDPLLSIKVTLRRIRPPIWRRLVMPSSSMLRDLHLAIYAAMGWQQARVYFFEIGGLLLGDMSRVSGLADDDENITLGELREFGQTRFIYYYDDDAQDYWQFSGAIEKDPPKVTEFLRPTCIGGRRNSPPEACDGPAGYEKFLAAIADPGNQAQREWISMIGQDFDPERFSVKEASDRLAFMFRHPSPF